MRWPARALLAALAAALVLGLVYRDTIGAQARAAIVLADVLDVPVATWFAHVVTKEPRADELVLAGAPTTRVRPGGGGPWPAIVFVNGATREGRRHPDVQRLARALARAGWVVLVPDLPGLPQGSITERTAGATVAVALAAARMNETDEGRISLLGVSVGATLALLAAEDARLATRVDVVSGIAPFVDMPNVIRLATTGVYRDGARLVPYAVDDYVGLAVARSLASALPASAKRDVLVRELQAIDDETDDPLARLRGVHMDGDPGAVVALLANRDPRRFDRLYARLPRALRGELERLSPITNARRLRARVEIASAPHDKYFPLAEARALERARPRLVHVTVTGSFHHVLPEASVGALDDLWRLNGFAVRTLRDAR